MSQDRHPYAELVNRLYNRLKKKKKKNQLIW